MSPIIAPMTVGNKVANFCTPDAVLMTNCIFTAAYEDDRRFQGMDNPFTVSARCHYTEPGSLCAAQQPAQRETSNPQPIIRDVYFIYHQ